MFNRLDGIDNDRFILSASYKMKDGRILFGTTNSFIAFNPKAIRLTYNMPLVMLTGIGIGDHDYYNIYYRWLRQAATE